MENKIDTARTDLKKYYKYVKNCGTCKRKFGVDSLETVICPSCVSSRWRGR